MVGPADVGGWPARQVAANITGVRPDGPSAVGTRWRRPVLRYCRSPMAVPDEPARALAQDGGLACDDLTPHLPEGKWDAVAGEFFLTR